MTPPQTPIERFLALPLEDRQAVLASLTEAEALALTTHLESVDKVYDENMLSRLYPEEGLLSRHSYPKQMELYELGKDYQYRALLGGNGCVSPWTRIETGQGPRPIVEFLGSADAAVQTWDGERLCTAQAGGAHLKEFAPAFRLLMGNGQWFDCNRRHRVLTSEGWTSLDQLILLSSGLRYTREGQDSQGNCRTGSCSCDAPLLSGLGISPEESPEGDGAQGVCPCACAHSGASGRTRQCSRTWPANARLPMNVRDPSTVLALCDRFADPIGEPDFQWCAELFQGLLRFRTAEGRNPATLEDARAVCAQYASELQTGLSWAPVRALTVGQTLGGLGDWLFVPSGGPKLMGGNEIVAVVPLGVQPIMDLSVRGTECYVSAGVVHHNTGKTLCAAVELVYHVTGQYPEWWKGRRFSRGITAIAAGDTKETVRDIIQSKLLGDDGNYGTGVLPKSCILEVKVRPQSNGSVDWVRVRHIPTKRTSVIYFKSYDQGRKTFQGREVDFIWLDEECPMDIYQECVQRFRGKARDGRLLLTFTPLQGVTDVVKKFAPQFASKDGDDKDDEENRDNRACVFCSWDDVPHQSEDEKQKREAEMLSYEREARRLGIPVSGRGKVFTVEESSFVVAPFAIPSNWPRIFGADFGFGKNSEKSGTAFVWAAWCPDTDTAYLYDEYLKAEAPPSVHAAAALGRGAWIPGVGDFAGRQLDGSGTLDIYKGFGLDIAPADKAVYAGLQTMTQLLEEGRLRVFSTLQKWLAEYRLYSVGENDEIIKKRDHLMDATRYMLMAGRRRAKTKPVPKVHRQTARDMFGFLS